MNTKKQWGRDLADKPAAGTLVDDFDRAIKRTRAVAESGDHQAIKQAIVELHRLMGAHERIMKNRLEDHRGRSKESTLRYLERSHAALAAAALAISKLPDAESLLNARSMREAMARLAGQIEIAKNTGREENPLERPDISRMM